jgi:lactate/malate dehydrogenase, NAD binding domain
MPFVAILGAGPLGGAIAYALASRGRFDEVRLIDPEKTLAAGKALDILQAGPVDGSSTRVTGSASLENADGAWVTVLADPIQPDPVVHLAGLHHRSPGAMVVCADASHGLSISRAVATGSVAPDYIVGSAPLAVASAARALIALDVDLSPAVISVGVTAAGSPGTCRIDWGRTSIDGVAADVALQNEQQRRVDQRLAASCPPGPFTMAAAAATVAEAAWFGARQTFPCWWVTDGGSGAPSVEVLRFAPGGRARLIQSPAASAGLAASGAGR